MNKLILSGVLSLMTIASVVASNDDSAPVRPKVPCHDCADVTKLPRHQACGQFRYVMYQAAQIERERAEKAALKEQRRQALQAKFPTMKEIQESYSDDYMKAFKQFLIDHQAGMKPAVTDLLRPKSIFYVPCKNGMLVYRFDNFTQQVNSHMFNMLADAFYPTDGGAIFSVKKTAAQTKKELVSKAEESFLAECRNALRLNMEYSAFLKERGIPMDSDGQIRLMKIDIQHMTDIHAFAVITSAMSHLNEWGWLSQGLLDSVEKSLANSVFVQVKEKNMVLLNHIQGVRQ